MSIQNFLQLPFFKKSIVARIGTAMLAVSLMALVSMIGSVIVAQNTQGDAGAINLSGSLRMMSYKMVADSSAHQRFLTEVQADTLREDITEFERRLHSDVLNNVIPADGDLHLHQHYMELQRQWLEEIKPTLEHCLTNPVEVHDLREQIKPFVAHIDEMVLLLEKSTESKIKLLSLVQGVSLVMTIVIILISMLDINNNVVRPLNMLVALARHASSGNLTGRINYKSEDELGLLSDTYNQMAEELQKIYADLENRVELKTAQLQKTNEALQLLYNSNHNLHRKEDICNRFMPVMQQLETITPFGPISLTLRDPNKQAFREMTTQCQVRPSTCMDNDCNRCLVSEVDEGPHRELTMPIQVQDNYFGELTAQYQPTQQPSKEEIRLLETIAENLATSLSLERKANQEQHMSLIEERSVIARELHDSLAQSLSYLKMQVARLSMLREQEASTEQLDDVVIELKEGLNNAYRQLRELLSTFRLKLDTPGLEPALSSTIEEFSERLGFAIDYHYRIHHLNLTANEEIHVLQIVREALANVVKHSQASAVSVLVNAKQDQVTVSIRDNGVGFPEGQDTTNHYGLVIMQDRAATLDGELKVSNLVRGGVHVQVIFTSKHH
jgi:two-component system nitrate/nitrite sensor histidine kinase NarX